MSIQSETIAIRRAETVNRTCVNVPLRIASGHRENNKARSPQQISLAMDRIFRRPAVATSERKTVIELSHAVS